MAAELETLRSLQGADTEIKSLRDELDKLRQAVHDKQNEVSGLRQQIETADASIRDLQTRQRLREVEVEQFNSEIEGLRGHLKEARNNKEYAGFNTEIRGRVAEMKSVEDQVLQILEDIDVENQKKTDCDQAIQTAQTECQELEKGISGEVGKYEEAIAKQIKDRDKLASKIDDKLCDEYDRLFSRYEGEAMCLVEDGACSGCWMALSSGDLSKLIVPGNFIRCPSCGRILEKPSES